MVYSVTCENSLKKNACYILTENWLWYQPSFPNLRAWKELKAVVSEAPVVVSQAIVFMSRCSTFGADT